MASLPHAASPPAIPDTLDRPKVWAWPLAALLGFPIGGTLLYALVTGLLLAWMLRRTESHARGR